MKLTADQILEQLKSYLKGTEEYADALSGGQGRDAAWFSGQRAACQLALDYIKDLEAEVLEPETATTAKND